MTKEVPKKPGFTLIELLVVVAIIGLLAGGVSVSYTKSLAKSRDARRKEDILNIAAALEAYYAFNKFYPGVAGKTYHSRTATQPWIPASPPITDYISSLPVETGPDAGDSTISDNPCDDNDSSHKRNYNYVADNQTPVSGYALLARLEIDSDPDVISKPGCPTNIKINFGNRTDYQIKGHPIYAIWK